MKNKIEKLIAHEKSARSLGNTDEADAYQKKIHELESREKESRTEPKIQRRWQCSCRYELVLGDDNSAGTQVIIDIMLAPHRRSGHRLALVN